jgi:hypothetical protein
MALLAESVGEVVRTVCPYVSRSNSLLMQRAHRGGGWPREQVTLKLNDKEESSVRGKLLQIMEKEDVALETEVRDRSVPGFHYKRRVF